MLFRMLGFPAGNKVDNLLADLLLDYPIRKVGIAFYAEIDADFDDLFKRIFICVGIAFQVDLVKGMKIAFLNYTYGTNGITVQGDVVVDYIDRAKIHTDIQAARRKGADLVVACIHWGVEYQLVQNKEQELLADWLVDEGVDLVIGGHPHVIQPMQMHRAKDGRQVLVVYSMGNFISGMRKPDTRGGAMVRVKVGWQNGKPVVKSAGYKLVFVQDPDKSVPNYSLVPADREWLVRADQRSFFDAFCLSARKIFNRYNNGVPEDSWNWSPNLLIPFLVDSDAVEK